MKIVTGREKLREEIDRTKNMFDDWYANGWWKNDYTREQMLSEDSPVPHIYYKMCKTENEIIKEYPYEVKRDVLFVKNMLKLG